MKFYDEIADYYDYIFPFNPAQRDFVTSFYEEDNIKNLTLLDIGCGTGNLSIKLAEYFAKVTALDLDSKMINMANDKTVKGRNIDFLNMNMLDVNKVFSGESFDTVISFGNTIVHLTADSKVKNFFSAIKDVMKPGGMFLFQIINYDRIIEQEIKNLPTIENEHIKFERDYSFDKDNELIKFSTILTVKKKNIQLKNCVELNPLRKTAIESFLTDSGFKNIRFYGNFKKDSLTESSIPLIVNATL